MVLYRRNPCVLPDSPHPTNSKIPVASDFSKMMTKIHKETETTLEEAASRMKAQYDKHKRPAREYYPGDLVWLDTANLHLPRPKKKLNDKRVGSFKILEKTGALAYKLKLPPHWKIHPRFNEKLLTPYNPPLFPNQEQPPPLPPDLIDSEEEWEIEEVLDSKPLIDYFIKWVRHTREHNSWVTESEMGNTKEAIADYEEKVAARSETVAKLHLDKIETTKSCSPLALLIDHDYKDSHRLYLVQREDRTQIWLKDLDVNKFKTFLEEYWTNQGVLPYEAEDARPNTYRSQFHQEPLSRTLPHQPPKPRGRQVRLHAATGLDDPLDHPTDPPINKPEEEEPKLGGSKGKEKDKKFTYKDGSLRGDLPLGPYADPVAQNLERWSLPGAPDKFDPSYEPPNPMGANPI
ncbi:uncharacterized protein ARMOST_22598 [Armillaria ostoyae]|uniref:Chromo domain-containing protein n=1 Tax=Armillaria ostoyae TaxID=47428 RepID=A0A284SDE8_ARMOS|nr:uncharacterized protein ARMOST_22598 [Armillaria ostoyae]